MSFWKSNKDKIVVERLLDEELYGLAYKEIESGVRRDGLWAQAVLDGQGNETSAKLAYLKLLVQRLKDEHYLALRAAEEKVAARRAQAYAKAKAHEQVQPETSSTKERKEVLLLCVRLKRGHTLSHDDYHKIARAGGISISMPLAAISISPRYTVIRGTQQIKLKGTGQLRKWLVENIVPQIERCA